jgi:RNA-directed DNA polymerase
VKAKIHALTHRLSEADMGAVIGRLNQILRGWTTHFRRAVCEHTLNRLRYFVNGA